MPRSSGTYTPPASSWNPTTSGASATKADWDALLADLTAAMTQSISRDGQSPVTANLPMASFKLTGLSAGTVAGDSVRFEQLPSIPNILPVASGGTGLVTGENLALSGEVKMWPTSAAPIGHLLCNGSAVSRTTYATLFAVVSTIFGVGDGSTTFNLPDFRDRMPVGAGTTYAANASGGSADAIVVSHTHTATSTDSGHAHPSAAAASGAQTLAAGSNGAALNGGSTGTASAVITTTVNATGSSGTNANLPPYRGIYFIIKT